MKKISVYFILFFFKYAVADNSVSNLIVENCTSCHNLNNVNNKNIPSLKNLSKKEFIKIMRHYKDGDQNNVMSRISKVLTNQDIENLSRIIYDE